MGSASEASVPSQVWLKLPTRVGIAGTAETAEDCSANEQIVASGNQAEKAEEHRAGRSAALAPVPLEPS